MTVFPDKLRLEDAGMRGGSRVFLLERKTFRIRATKTQKRWNTFYRETHSISDLVTKLVVYYKPNLIYSKFSFMKKVALIL